MKKAYSAFLFLLLFSFVANSQTGTIKIAKPPAAKKDTIIPPKKKYIGIGIDAGSNYTFKGIHQYGYYADIRFPTHHFLFWGLGYAHEIEYYSLSAYNKETLKPELAYTKSVNQSDYAKLDLGISYNMAVGARSNFYFMLCLEPQYLLQTKNQYGRLNYSDFNKFNLAGSVSIGVPIPLVHRRCSVHIRYSKDFIDNLKDKNLYNETGVAIGKQKSKTNLLSLSLSMNLAVRRK